MKLSEGVLVGVATFLGVINPILSWGGGLVAGIWLLIEGQWPIVLFGILIMFIDTWVYSLITLPIQLLLGGITLACKRIKWLMWSFLTLSVLFTNTVIVGWSLLFIIMADSLSGGDGLIWPLLIGGYCIATGLFTSLAQKESRDNEAALFGVMLSELSYVLLVTVRLVLGAEWVIVVAIVLILLWTPLSLSWSSGAINNEFEADNNLSHE
ncbi:MAG: hypothetical protein WC805_03800 [Patescibacteria group bacterium]|jgi:hypothetical protein